MQDPKNIGSYHADPSGLDLFELFVPVLTRETGIVKLPDNRDIGPSPALDIETVDGDGVALCIGAAQIKVMTDHLSFNFRNIHRIRLQAVARQADQKQKNAQNSFS